MLEWIAVGAVLFGIVELAAAREQWRARFAGWPTGPILSGERTVLFDSAHSTFASPE